MRKRAIIAATPLILLAACSSRTHSYDSATELRSAAVNAGLHCTGYNPATPPKGASDAGICVGGTPAQFVVYKDEGAAKTGTATARGALKDGEKLLTGPNWYLLTDGDDINTIKDAVGGKVQGPVSS